ncbi:MULTISPECIES: hypothetical protein [Bradyrhizobium]|uniref:Uncharacterized protein n=1 Tax=Bradyrhizobium neotropicale TaxID=1497615 RepID=A0A176ZDT6_9BRAD|nr:MULTISPECIES: hypothetical protein [Bradyrhizobium]OAF18035.1 hypothetical protein AXW67_05820 [Bradyrhizobium neotropicale]
MPLAAYFWKIGALLLALLFVADFCLPRAPTVRDAAADRPTIRIHSEQKLPERVVLDTSAAPVVSNTATAIAAAPIAPPVVRAETSAAANALAMLPRPPESVDRKRQRKPQHVATRPKRHVKPQMDPWARPQFAWFGFRPW